jgi:hypothetical protein
MWAQNGISGKSRQQKQAYLRKMRKGGYGENVLGFFRRPKQQSGIPR